MPTKLPFLNNVWYIKCICRESCISMQFVDLCYWSWSFHPYCSKVFAEKVNFYLPSKLHDHWTFLTEVINGYFAKDSDLGRICPNLFSSSTSHISLGQVWAKSTQGYLWYGINEIWGVWTDGQSYKPSYLLMHEHAWCFFSRWNSN